MASLAFSTGSLTSLGAKTNRSASFSLLDTFSLTSFDDEQEEYPRIVTNGKGESWMFSLRRLPYPQNQEELACYKIVNGKWKEAGTASSKAGQYENPAALCLPGGEPLVVWNSIKNGNWEVQLTRYKNGKPSNPISFVAPKGRALNPRLVAGENATARNRPASIS